MNDQILSTLAEAWPEAYSVTRIMVRSGVGPRTTDRIVRELVNAGRIEVKPHSHFNGYRLTREEAEAQGCDMRPKVPGRTDRLDDRPLYVPKPMQPARADAEQAMQVMSRDGDKRLPFARPISMVSTVRGGA